MTLEKITELTKLEPPEIRRLTKLGYFPRPKDDQYDEQAVIAGAFRYYREKLSERGRPSKEHATLPTFDSMDQCTAIAHIPRAVMQMAKKGGCQAFTANSRVILGKLLEWIFSTERDENATDYSQQFMRWRAEIEKIKLDEKKELLADRPTIRRGAGKIMTSIFDTLERVFRYELPASCVGKNEQEIATENGKAINDMRTKLDAEFERLGVE